MKKGVIIICILIILLVISIIFGLNILLNKQNVAAEYILNNVLNALSGNTEYLNNDIPVDIKRDLKLYQENNLVSDDTTFVLLDNVSQFNNQIELLKKLKELEHFYNNLPPDIEDIDKYVSERFGDVDVKNLDEKYSIWFDESALEMVNENIIEEDNQYLIKLNDLDIAINKNCIIYHKGFMRELNMSDIGKETYTMRQNNPQYKYYIVKTDSSIGKVTFICASEYDKKIIEVEVNFKLFKPYNIKVK